MYHSSLAIKALSLLEKNEIQPSWSLFGTGPAIIDAFSKGELDIGYIGLAPSAIGIARGLSVKCIAGGHVEGTIVVAKMDYKTVEELRGDIGKALSQFKRKRIGVPRRGSLHDVFLRYYLKQFNLGDSVEVINFDWADFIPEAMINGEIEAACGTPPLAVLLGRLMRARIVIPQTMIWPNNPSYAIVTTKQLLRDSPELLESFLTVHKHVCCDLLHHDRKNTAHSVARMVGLVDEEFVLETYDISPKYCASLSREFVDSSVKLFSVLKELGYISKDLRSDDVFDDDLVSRVHPEPPHYV